MVLSRPGGDNDPPCLVSQVLSDAAIVPAMVIEINHYQSRHLKTLVEKYKKHSVESSEETDRILEIICECRMSKQKQNMRINFK